MGTGTSTLLWFLRVGGPWPVGTMTGLSTSPADLGEGGFSTGCRSPPGAGIPGSCCTSLPWFGPFPPLPLQLCRPAPPSASTEREPTLWESLPSRVQERQEPRHRPSQFSGFTRVDCVSHTSIPRGGPYCGPPTLQTRKLWLRRNLPPRWHSWQAQLENLNLAAWPKHHCPLLPPQTHGPRRTIAGRQSVPTNTTVRDSLCPRKLSGREIKVSGKKAEAWRPGAESGGSGLRHRSPGSGV